MGGDQVYGELLAPAVMVAWIVAGAASLSVWAVVRLDHPRLRPNHLDVAAVVAAAFLAGAVPVGAAVRRFRYVGLLVCGVLTPTLTAVAVWAAGPDGAPSLAQCYVFYGCSTHLLFRRRDADILLAVMLGGCGLGMALNHAPREWIGVWIVVICETSIVAYLTGWLTRTLFDLATAEALALGEVERTRAELDQVIAGTRGLLDRTSQGLQRPLDAVIDLSSSLSTTTLSDRQAEYVADISSSAVHLRSVLAEIGAIAAVDDLQLGPVNLATVVAECVSVVGVAASSRGVRIETLGSTRWVTADERKIKQIVLNLVANAVRFSPPGGRVLVSIGNAGGGALVAVRDEGPGIDPSEHDRIFLAFEQASTTTPGGTGLGLTVSQEYAGQHGGHITVASRPGAGATFRLWLPDAPPLSAGGPVANAPVVERRGVGMWDDGGVLEQLIGVEQRRRFLTRLIGTLAFGEGLVLMGGFIPPRPPGFRMGPTFALGLAAAIFGAVLLWSGRVLLSSRGARVCGALGVVGTALAAWWAGSYASAAAASVFVVIGVLGFEGLALDGAAVLAGAIGIAYAVVLATQHGDAGAPERWMITMALVVAGGWMIRWFVNLVPEQARTEHAARFTAEGANAALVRVSERHREVLAHVSHELRTPLNAIIGFAEILQGRVFGELSPAQAAEVDNIVTAGRELLAFVNDILELARAEAGRVALEMGPASMSEVVATAVRGIGPVDVTPGVEEVWVDARRLTQALAAVVAIAQPSRVSIGRDGSIAVYGTCADGARSEVALRLADRLMALHGGGVTVDPGVVTLSFSPTLQLAPNAVP